MHFHRFLTLGGLVLAGSSALAAKLERDNVPKRCLDVCGPALDISRRCDDQNDNDAAEMRCICNANGAQTQIPICAACINENGQHNSSDGDHDHDHDGDHDGDDDGDNDNDRRALGRRDDYDDNEALQLVDTCKFSTTTYNPTSASATSAAGTMMTTTAASTTGAGARATSTGDADRDSDRSTGAAATSTASPTGNAAALIAAPTMVPLAAVVGLLPFALL